MFLPGRHQLRFKHGRIKAERGKSGKRAAMVHLPNGLPANFTREYFDRAVRLSFAAFALLA